MLRRPKINRAMQIKELDTEAGLIDVTETNQPTLPIRPKNILIKTILKPFKWIKNRYSTEVKQWTNPFIMFLFFTTDLFLFVLFLMASSIFRMENLPDDKYKFLIGAFGFTASVAGLSSITISKKVNANLLRIRILFIHAAIILVECVALVYLVDLMNDPGAKWWLPKLIPFSKSCCMVFYSWLIAICGYLWFAAFAKLNEIFWQYNYTWKYFQQEEVVSKNAEN